MTSSLDATVVPDPAVSVIVPLYNKQAFIRRAIDSVLAQTLQDFELIVVDDGSTDEGVRIAHGVGDARLRVISQPNQGPGAARNRGAAAARGELLAFLDADDEWMPEFLDASVACLRRSPDCGFCISGFYDGPLRRVSQARLDTRGYGPGRYAVDAGTRPDSFDWLLYAYLPSTAVFRRETFESCGGFYDRYARAYGEDMFLFVAAALCRPFWRLAAPLVWYHSESAAYSRQQVLTCLLVDPERLFQICPASNHHVLRGLLADRAILEALGMAYAGDFSHTDALFQRFLPPDLQTPRARNARRQIRALEAIPRCIRVSAGSVLSRILHRLFPLRSGRPA